ncbi:menaquinone biosynthesis protein [Desulfopila sp. IMCC35008]|uniref:menaquinone biosynthetic enzyme MqnA/MqnD family protein n=1 Tax=Desulfopila sp. IMCC35008 TaxID=2653858 RepID=UPI001F118A96|nr:menaquinone biosynthesis protein [Desulfopila sp. IMCC35008]
MNRMRPVDADNLDKITIDHLLPEVCEVRIGMVNYINTAPIYETWKKYPLQPGWHVLEAPPSTLNKLLAQGELDLGFVSCYEYARNPEKYEILPDLSISASGPVGSVFLFSRKKVGTARFLKVLLSSQSETSVALVKIILEEFYNQRPDYFVGVIDDARQDGCDGVLAIGDDALRLKKAGIYDYCLDLGEVWTQQTGLPFVFAVCAVRREFVEKEAELLEKVYHKLLRCREEGCAELMGICKIAAPRIPMNIHDCYHYLKGIEYDLGQKKVDALIEFFTHLIQRQEVEANALPLKFVKI